MKLMFWNLKYFGLTSANYRERVVDLAERLDRHKPDIAVFVELTANADAVLEAVKGELKETSFLSKAVNAGGGNNEHFAVLLSPQFGQGAEDGLEVLGDVPLGGGTRKIAHLSIGRLEPVNAFGLFICHPSPCALTFNTALKDAGSFIQSRGGRRSIMVGDFNSDLWDTFEASNAYTDAATHLGASGTLRVIDGAVFDAMDVSVDWSQRTTSSSAKSDHAYILFNVA
ncbi:MAG TPA: endonuclease/exonuclease/phosphatase family protein [Sphingomicrobium sp.]|nr:endonuclease/exonuclease/phosphatase family protein [Sphingomicrobium sp.]